MFETLYEIDKKGKIREWKIKVLDNTIVTEYGLLDGQKIKTEEVIKKGKNIGKKNETTPEEQANNEAKSKWKKKLDKGYSTSIDNNKTNYKPMLAQDYKKHKSKVVFPCYIQPKLDGYRMIYDGINERLLTRTGKEFSILKNTPLHEELKKFSGNILDGELYVHDKDFTFETYGILRKKKLSKEDHKILDKIIYNVYDVMSNFSYDKRREYLEKKIKNFKHIKNVKTFICNDPKEIEKYHSLFLQEGYEGSMIRNSNSQYIHNRTTNLLKYKNFDDDEFKIIGFNKEKDTVGDGSAPIIFQCITKEGKKFDVPMKGTRKERTVMYNNGKKYIGKMLSVQFFGYTESGVPRFPKSLRAGDSSIRKN